MDTTAAAVSRQELRQRVEQRRDVDLVELLAVLREEYIKLLPGCCTANCVSELLCLLACMLS